MRRPPSAARSVCYCARFLTQTDDAFVFCSFRAWDPHSCQLFPDAESGNITKDKCCPSERDKKRAPLRLQSRLKARGRTARPAHGCCVARAAAAGGFHGPRTRRRVAPRSGRRRLPRAAHPAPRCPAQRPPEAAAGRAPGAASPRAAAAGGCRAPGAASPRAAAAGGCRGVRIYLEPRCPAQPQAGPQRPPEA